MTESQLIGVVLFVIYLIDGAVWLRHGSFLFVGGNRIKSASDGLGNQHGVVATLALWPPFGRSFQVDYRPFAICRDGVLLGAYERPAIVRRPNDREEIERRLIRWEGVAGVAARDRFIVFGDGSRVGTGGELQAIQWAEQLRGLADVDDERREQAIADYLREELDCEGVEARFREVEDILAPVRWAGGLTLMTLVWAAVWTWHYGAEYTWRGTTVAVGAAVCWTIFCYWRASLKLGVGRLSDRLSNAVTMIVAPPCGVRAAEHLSRYAVQGRHPLAVAAVLLPKEEFLELARLSLADLRSPLPHHEPPAEWRGLLAGYRAALIEEIESMLQRLEIAPESLAAAPSPESELVSHYCPRCLQQTSISGECSDCPEVNLRALDGKPAA